MTRIPFARATAPTAAPTWPKPTTTTDLPVDRAAQGLAPRPGLLLPKVAGGLLIEHQHRAQHVLAHDVAVDPRRVGDRHAARIPGLEVVDPSAAGVEPLDAAIPQQR
jgi:hypothetical protein